MRANVVEWLLGWLSREIACGSGGSSFKRRHNPFGDIIHGSNVQLYTSVTIALIIGYRVTTGHNWKRSVS